MPINLFPKITLGRRKETVLGRFIRSGLFLLVVSFPFINRDLFSLFHPQIFPARVILVALLALFIWQARRKAPSWGKLKGLLANDPLLFLLLSLWLARAISIALSKNLVASVSLLVFYSSMVGLYLLLKRYFSFALYQTHLLVVSAVGLFGVLEVLWALQRTAFPGVLLGGNYLRVPATFYDANHLPAYLLTVLPFLLVLVWQARVWWKKLVIAGLLGLLVLLLLSTFSRSGMLGAGVAFGIFFLLMLSLRYYRKALAMGGVGALVLVVALLTSQTEYSLFKRAGSVLNPAEKSTTAHETLLRGEWHLFLRHPILGVGYGSFSEAFRSSDWGKAHLFVDPTEDIRLPAHSIWLETLTETGLVGFIPYSLLMFLVLLTASRALRISARKKEKLYLSALASGLVGILSAGIFYSYNLSFFWFYLFTVYFYSLRVIARAKSEGSDRPEKVDWLELVLVGFLLLFTGAIVFFQLGKRGLLDWDEAIYAGVAKNILVYRDFLTLRWLGDLPWFEKPPLYMWFSATMIYFYGITAFAVRFPSALFGTSGVIGVYFLGKTLFRRKLAGFLSAMTLATTTVYLYYARNGMLDVSFTALSVWAFLFYWLGQEKKNRLALFVSGAFFGASAMMKGFVVVVPLAVVALFEGVLAFRARGFAWRRLLRMFIFIGGGFALVALPWHLAMLLKYGREFFDSYFIYHVFKRGTEAIEGKSAPLLWYLTVIKVGFRIWAVVLLASAPFVAWQGLAKRKLPFLFLVLWAGTVFVFFSWAKSKLVWYILPIYPALALINGALLSALAGYLSQRLPRQKARWLSVGVALTVALLGSGYLYRERARVFPPDYTREEVALIKIRDALDRRNDILFLLPGIASPIPRYYNQGPVREISKEELPELLRAKEKLHFLLDFPAYQELKADLAREGISLRLIGSVPSEGDLVLVEKP